MRTPILSAIMGLLLILLPTIAYGQSLEYVNSTLWTGASDMEVVGNYVYCAHPLGLMIFDISDPAMPVVCGKLACKGIGVKIAVSGDYVYLATEKAGIQIMEISNPFSPRLVASYQTNGKLAGIRIQDEYAYVLDYSSGMLILDISNPTIPELVGSYLSGLRGTALEISNHYAYIGYEFRHLHIVDISDPVNPAFICDLSSLFDFMSHDIIAIESKDTLLYVTTGEFELGFNSWPEYFYVFNIATPATPECDGYGMVNHYFDQISIHGDYAYLGSEIGIYIYDIANLSNEMNPVANYHHDNNANRVCSMINHSNNLFVMFSDGFEVLDVSSPISPVLSGFFGLSSYTTRVALQGNYTFAYGFGWLNTIDISSTEMTIRSRQGWHYFDDMAISGDYCYMARGYHGFGVINIENPTSPYIVDTVHIDGGLTEISAFGNRAFGFRSDYYSSINNVTTIINLDNPSAPEVAGVYNTGPGCEFHDALVWGNYVYLGTYAQPNLRIVNIENPLNPVQVNAIIDGQEIVRHGMCAQDHYLYINSGDFYVLDIADPASPQIVSQLPIHADIISVSGRYAFLASNDSLTVVDVSDPGNPALLTGCKVVGNYINGIESNDSLCIVSVLDGIVAYKLNPAQSIDESVEPEVFSVPQNYPNPFNAQTTINYSLPEAAPVNIAIYNIVGQKMAVIENGIVTAGEHRAVWDATGVPSGLYFARLEAGDRSQSIKLTVVK
jgi:hypothetical protein